MAVMIYLQVWDPRRQCARTCGRFWTRASRFGEFFDRRITPHIPVVSGLFKIILSFFQCLAAITRFDRIDWPDLFDDFLNLINEWFNFEIFALLPAQCLTEEIRLGFHFELLATLALPISYFFYTYFVLLLGNMNCRNWKKWFVQTWKSFNGSRSYKLLTLLMLVTCARFSLARARTECARVRVPATPRT